MVSILACSDSGDNTQASSNFSKKYSENNERDKNSERDSENETRRVSYEKLSQSSPPAIEFESEDQSASKIEDILLKGLIQSEGIIEAETHIGYLGAVVFEDLDTSSPLDLTFNINPAQGTDFGSFALEGNQIKSMEVIAGDKIFVLSFEAKLSGLPPFKKIIQFEISAGELIEEEPAPEQAVEEVPAEEVVNQFVFQFGSVFYWNNGRDAGSKFYWDNGRDVGGSFYWDNGRDVGSKFYWETGRDTISEPLFSIFIPILKECMIASEYCN